MTGPVARCYDTHAIVSAESSITGFGRSWTVWISTVATTNVSPFEQRAFLIPTVDSEEQGVVEYLAVPNTSARQDHAFSLPYPLWSRTSTNDIFEDSRCSKA